MTVWETQVLVMEWEAKKKRGVELTLVGAWHSAYFQRVKKLPSLESVLKDRSPKAQKEDLDDGRAFFEEVLKKRGQRK